MKISFSGRSPQKSGTAFRRGILRLLTGLGLAAAGGTACAQPAPPNAATAVPATWVRYARIADQKIVEWLSEDSEAAIRVRRYLAELQAAGGPGSYELELKIWIAADGVIESVATPPFVHAAARDDLRLALAGRTLPEPPPPGMRQPLRLAILAEFPEAEEPLPVSTQPVL